jgi:hypothetical protein
VQHDINAFNSVLPAQFRFREFDEEKPCIAYEVIGKIARIKKLEVLTEVQATSSQCREG